MEFEHIPIIEPIKDSKEFNNAEDFNESHIFFQNSQILRKLKGFFSKIPTKLKNLPKGFFLFSLSIFGLTFPFFNMLIY